MGAFKHLEMLLKNIYNTVSESVTQFSILIHFSVSFTLHVPICVHSVLFNIKTDDTHICNIPAQLWWIWPGTKPNGMISTFFFQETNESSNEMLWNIHVQIAVHHMTLLILLIGINTRISKWKWWKKAAESMWIILWLGLAMVSSHLCQP